MSQVLISTCRQATLELTLNRPECRNALSRALIAELAGAFGRADADPDVRSVIITGAPPAFCAGLDLREVSVASGAEAEHDAGALLTLYETIDGLSKPVIAAVNGPAVAGGAGLVSVCDIAICGRSGAIGYPEIKRGLVAVIVMMYLRRLVGERQARYLLLTGETLEAEEALQAGLVNEVVSDGELLPRARYFAAMFASYPRQALAETKALWNKIRTLQHAAAVEEARRLSVSLRLTEESRTGVAQFLSK